MSHNISKVAVAGVNGTLGEPVIKHLVLANYQVTLVTTKASQTRERFTGVQLAVTEADYTDIDSLASCLRNHDAVVSLISRTQVEAQIQLIEAAIAAGVPHIIPSCFGANSSIPEVRANPALESKIQMEDHLVTRANEGKITFTGIQTGVFFEWALGKSAFLLNPNAPTPIFDGGDTLFSMSSLEDIGKAVCNALGKSRELKNRFLLMHSVVLTQNQLIEMAKVARPDKEWKTMNLDTQTLWTQARQAYDAGARDAATMRGFFPRTIFGLGLGHFKPVDNGVLGIEQWDEKKLSEAVHEVLQTV